MRKLTPLFLALLLFIGGCTYFAPHKAKLEQKIEERARELNSGALVATRKAQQELQSTKVALSNNSTNLQGDITLLSTNFHKATNHLEKADEAVDLTESLLNRNENLIGKPIEDQTALINKLLGENKILKIEAQLVETFRQKQEQDWIAKQVKYEQRLQEYGTKYEQERNDKITRWLKWGSIILLAIGIPIAICVFFPPALSLLAGMFPRLLGAFGVGTIKATSNVTRAIGDIRWDFKKTAEVAPDKTFTAAEVQAIIDDYLKTHIEDDKATKNTVEYLREKNNV